MNMKSLAAAAIMAALALGGAASAQTISEEQGWKYKTAAERSVDQGNVVLMQQKQNNYYKQFKNGAASAFGTSGGLFGSSSSATSNYTQIINQTTNNCTSNASTGALSCGGGAVSGNTVGQTTTGTTVGAETTNTGNTVVNKPVTSTNSGNSGQTTIVPTPGK